VRRQGNVSRQESEARTESERRSALRDAAERSFARISAALLDNLAAVASASAPATGPRSGWSIQLNQAALQLSAATPHATGEWGGWQQPAFDVICAATVDLRIPVDRHEYEGRSHSLWFGDVREAGRYGWFETAFMFSPFIPKRGRQNPFALDPGVDAAKAVGSGMAEFQVAWPFTQLVVDDLDEFIDRWAGWFADAAAGRLAHPSAMPERSTQGSWRTA